MVSVRVPARHRSQSGSEALDIAPILRGGLPSISVGGSVEARTTPSPNGVENMSNVEDGGRRAVALLVAAAAAATILSYP